MCHPDEQVTVLDSPSYAGNGESADSVDGFELFESDMRDFSLVSKLLAERAIERIIASAASTTAFTVPILAPVSRDQRTLVFDTAG